MSPIAKRIRALRRVLGWNTARLAYTLEVSSRTIEDWEQDRTTPSGPALRLLEMLIQVNRIDIDEAMEGM